MKRSRPRLRDALRHRPYLFHPSQAIPGAEKSTDCFAPRPTDQKNCDHWSGEQKFQAVKALPEDCFRNTTEKNGRQQHTTTGVGSTQKERSSSHPQPRK